MKKYRIEFSKPMRQKHNIHHTDHLYKYIRDNMYSWMCWDRLPITIYSTQKNEVIHVITEKNWHSKLKELKEEEKHGN